jgi:opacity protein-like surface antigen
MPLLGQRVSRLVPSLLQYASPSQPTGSDCEKTEEESMRSAVVALLMVLSATTIEAAYITGGLLYVRSDDLSEEVQGVQSVTNGDDGYGLRIGAGRAWSAWRGELNLTGLRVTYGDLLVNGVTYDARTEVDAYTLSADLFYDFTPNRRIRPFVGIGAGHAWSEIQLVEVEGQEFEIDDMSTSNNIVQAHLGLATNVRDNVVAQLAYRYTLFYERETETNDTKTHVVEVGLRFGR